MFGKSTRIVDDGDGVLFTTRSYNGSLDAHGAIYGAWSLAYFLSCCVTGFGVEQLRYFLSEAKILQPRAYPVAEVKTLG